MMRNKIPTLAIVFLLFLSSCKENSSGFNKENKDTYDVVISKENDKKGRTLEIIFNNTKRTASLKINGETTELTHEPTASGVIYKNKQFRYTNWHQTTTVEKNGKLIFDSNK